MKEKHTRHCRLRMKYGDGYCECGGAGPAEPAPRCSCVDDERSCPKHNCDEIRKRLAAADKRIADLLERLSACREAWFDPSGDYEDDERIPRATDLRRKNWKKKL